MGCTASKLDNEDTVRRCKERRRLMKDAVYARHHLAASHSDYCRSLRMTGSALTVFAAGEPLSVSDQTPAVLLRTPSSLSRASTIPPPPRRVIPSPSPSLYHNPPPPPPPAFAPSPTIASSKLPHILSASSRSSSRRNRKQAVRLPHILSESSVCSSPKGPHRARSNNFEPNFTYDANQNQTFSTTASQTSSVWNWENFYPPSPPDSEYFQRRHPNDDDKASTYSNYNKHETHKSQTHHIDVEDEEETEREEVHYSEWDDHYNSTTTTSSEEDDDDEGDRDSRSEMGTQSNFGSSVHDEPKHAKSLTILDLLTAGTPPPNTASMMSKM